ncbi:hypothetical protein DL96DRAFT_1652307 [Flagelloscypha sp. PMI_526]|nr:hypothetical protein DL96DRAFT_1652307 [Flagelloscypha sp. PMI_526]
MLSELASLSAEDIFQADNWKAPVIKGKIKLNPRAVEVLNECLALQRRPVFLLEDTIDEMVEKIQTTATDTAKLLKKLFRSLKTVKESQEQALALREKLLTLKERPIAHIPHLPMDIARHIFMMATEENVEEGRTLSLVSSQVQRWVDPSLFYHISIPWHSPEAGFVSSRVHRWARALNVVNNLTHIQKNAIFTLSEPFSRLETIEFELGRDLSVWDFPIPTLRHMRLGSYVDFTPSEVLGPLPRRLMKSVTTLHISFDHPPHNFPWHDLIHAEKLAFLVIDTVEADIEYRLDAFTATFHEMLSLVHKTLTVSPLEVILWADDIFTFFNLEEWQSSSGVLIDSRLVLGSVISLENIDFGKLCVLDVEDDYWAERFWSLEGDLFDRARTALQTRSK